MTKATFQHIVLHEPTAQQVFDTTAKYLFNQKERCMYGLKCAYRNKDNTNACAAGIYIPTEHPASSAGGDIGHVLGKYEDLQPWMYEHEDLLSELQSVHGTPERHCISVNSEDLLVKRLNVLANRRGLKMVARPQRTQS